MERKKVLIIDDEKGFCNVLRMNLQLTQKFEATTAYDGKEGIRLAKKIKPDVILLDIMMPGMDGFKVLKALKSNSNTMPIPVIMLTAIGETEAKIKAGEMYSEYYITKPVKSQDLILKIETVLNLRNS